MSDRPPYADYIEEALWSLVVPVAALKKMKRNPRKHDKKSIKAKAASLKIFKQQKPVVVSADGEIIAGNGTFEAAVDELHWEYIAASKSSLTADEALAYAVADNKTQESSKFDYDIVGKMFRDLDKQLAGATGFSASEIEDLVKAAEPHPPLGEGDGPEDSDARRLPSTTTTNETTPGASHTVDPGDHNAHALPRVDLVFSDDAGRGVFLEWTRELRSKYPDIPTVGDRIVEWLRTEGGSFS